MTASEHEGVAGAGSSPGAGRGAGDGTPAVDELLARTRERGARMRRRRRLLAGAGAGGTGVVIALVLSLVLVVLPNGTSSTGGGGQPGLVVAARIGGAVEYSTTAAVAAPLLGSASEREVVSGEESFAFRLLRQLEGGGTASDEVVSPSSLSAALAMLELGARGGTESQIASVLGTPSLSATQQAAGWDALDADLDAASAKDGVTLQQANSLWSEQGLELKLAFVDSLRRHFGAGLWQADFDTPAGVAALNQWVDQQTHGKIPQLLPPGPLAALLVLADAVYFKGAWQAPFQATTSPGSFSTGDGKSVSVQYMTTSEEGIKVPWKSAPGYDAVALPYKGGRFSALVVMPKRESLGTLVAGLGPAALNRIVSSLGTSSVAITMPTFELSTTAQLVPDLQAMGMHAAFGDGADLSGITSVLGLYVEEVVQKAFLHVTPAGTEAAAATGVSVGTSAVARPTSSLTINHPFLFLLRDDKTGAILFASTVTDPTGAAPGAGAS